MRLAVWDSSGRTSRCKQTGHTHLPASVHPHEATSHRSSLFSFSQSIANHQKKESCQGSVLGAMEYFEFSAGNLEQPVTWI